jgi:hypothetical protein
MRCSYGVAALAAGLSLAAGAGAALAATPASALPDWSGVWQNAGAPNSQDLFDGATADPPRCRALAQPCQSHPPYNAAGKAHYEVLHARALAGALPDPASRCMPRGTPGNMRTADQIEFVVRPEKVWVFVENNIQTRHIYTDGRGHRHGRDAFPSYTGDSIGHWEGDTLVVDTVHLRSGLTIDRSGVELSDRAHINERFRRLDANTFEILFTIEDPKYLTKPWVVRRLYKRVPHGRIFDYACAENARNTIDAEGVTHTLDANGKQID